MSSVTADQRIMPLCCRLSPLRCRFCDDSPCFGNAPPQSSEQRRKSLLPTRSPFFGLSLRTVSDAEQR